MLTFPVITPAFLQQWACTYLQILETFQAQKFLVLMLTPPEHHMNMTRIGRFGNLSICVGFVGCILHSNVEAGNYLPGSHQGN